MPKGTVNVEVFNSRLRLAWSWQGKRFWLYVGLPDTTANRKVAEIKARTIELDIASNNKPALAELGIDYRKPYNTRHTLISHGLEAGMNPVAIAALTGHDVRTLYENYARLVNPPQLPDLVPLSVAEGLPVFDPVSKADSQVDAREFSQ